MESRDVPSTSPLAWALGLPLPLQIDFWVLHCGNGLHFYVPALNGHTIGLLN